MSRRNDWSHPVSANTVDRRGEAAAARIAGAHAVRFMRQQREPLPRPHAADHGASVRPRHQTAPLRAGPTRCARARPCARTPGDSAVAVKTLIVAP